MAKKPPLTVTVNRRSLLVRLERASKKTGQKIRADRLGQKTRYLVINKFKNELVEVDIDLEEYAKKIGVMEPWETLADDK